VKLPIIGSELFKGLLITLDNRAILELRGELGGVIEVLLDLLLL
jgi:hypothetical protein